MICTFAFAVCGGRGSGRLLFKALFPVFTISRLRQREERRCRAGEKLKMVYEVGMILRTRYRSGRGNLSFRPTAPISFHGCTAESADPTSRHMKGVENPTLNSDFSSRPLNLGRAWTGSIIVPDGQRASRSFPLLISRFREYNSVTFAVRTWANGERCLGEPPRSIHERGVFRLPGLSP